jgi:hypothetical protein
MKILSTLRKLIFQKPIPHKCETCRYLGRNITREPCIYCENGSEW